MFSFHFGSCCPFLFYCCLLSQFCLFFWQDFLKQEHTHKEIIVVLRNFGSCSVLPLQILLYLPLKNTDVLNVGLFVFCDVFNSSGSKAKKTVWMYWNIQHHHSCSFFMVSHFHSTQTSLRLIGSKKNCTGEKKNKKTKTGYINVSVTVTMQHSAAQQ